MRLSYRALLLLMLACGGPACGQNAQCEPDKGKPVLSLDELPDQIQEMLGRARTGASGIADIGGKFNPTDVSLDGSIPMRRLVSGIAGRQCIWLTVEYGGIAHYEKQHEYWHTEGGWIQVKASSLKPKLLHTPVPAQ